jgi:hypothetical protein
MDSGLEKQAVVQRQIIQQVRGCTWVILWRGGFYREPNSGSVPGADLLQRFIQRHYTLLLQNRTYQVLKLRGHQPSIGTAT